jgi:hypothetical protein
MTAVSVLYASRLQVSGSEYRPENCTSWLTEGFNGVFLSPSRQMLRWYFKTDNGHFVLHSLHNSHDHFTIQCNRPISNADEETSLNKQKSLIFRNCLCNHVRSISMRMAVLVSKCCHLVSGQQHSLRTPS